MNREEVLRIIEEARREQRAELTLQDISELPDEIGQLTSLEVLNLHDNRLTTLPGEIGQLTSLKELNLNDNQLAMLPDEIGQLTSLKELDLNDNQLTTLPESLGHLTSLEFLYLQDNRLTTLPESFDQLASLQALDLMSNELTTLPESIGQLISLEFLYLEDNRLTTLPVSLGRLGNLESLFLEGNPLNPALQSAYDAGLEALKSYLRSLEDVGRRELLYEAKLMLVGEGNVGKTTLLKALTGQEPKKGEPTTHGINIDIKAMHLPHPEMQDVRIQLNSWDFGGQEVYRITHQFFFSRRSIYLIVWEPRMGAQQCQVEDWLKMIQLRVGDDARVIIVSTHCKTGERIARIDKSVLMRDFGSIIAGFHEVDSLVDDPATGEKTGIAELKVMIADSARYLEQMGIEFNRDWKESRDELLAMEKPRISYDEFAAACARHGMDAIATATLANLMHDLGYIVYYGDDERLKNDVVLQPEWLTKAIGFVLEDRTTQEMSGILPDSRLKEVWWDHSLANEPRYDPELYPFFLRLMERYDVLYRLEEGDASLIAQHVPQVRPDLPWLPEEEPAPERRRIALVCVMEESPPGLVPWMIVRTHQYAYRNRLHWQKGVFLRNKSHGEAVIELRDRAFHMYAEAVWPEFFMNVLRQTLQKLITDNWPGLKGRYFFAVPCRKQTDSGACDGRFDIDALRQFLEEGDETHRCERCRTRQKIIELLYGFEQEGFREQFLRIETKIDSGFKGMESQLANSLMATLRAIASESKDGPRLFTIEPSDGNWRRPFTAHNRLRLWCEADGCQHPVLEEGKGEYTVEATREWARRIAPYANFIAGVLKTLLPMVAPAIGIYFGPKAIDEAQIKDHLDLMKEATGKLNEDFDISDPGRLKQGMLTDAERSGVLALHSMLREADPHHEKLGLRRVPTYTGDYLWLCQKHYEQSQPKIPDTIA